MKNNNLKAIYEDASQWARWIALYEAVNMIADKCDEKNIPFDKINICPLDIKKLYMEPMEDIIARKILKQEHNIDVHYTERNIKTDDYQFV